MKICQLCLNSYGGENSCEYPQNLLALCCKYLHPVLTSNTESKQPDEQSLAFCRKCFESTMQLVVLSEQLEYVQNSISELVFVFSLEILHRRAKITRREDIREKNNNSGKRFIEFDLSAFPNFDVENSYDFPSDISRSSSQFVAEVPPETTSENVDEDQSSGSLWPGPESTDENIATDSTIPIEMIENIKCEIESRYATSIDEDNGVNIEGVQDINSEVPTGSTKYTEGSVSVTEEMAAEENANESEENSGRENMGIQFNDSEPPNTVVSSILEPPIEKTGLMPRLKLKKLQFQNNGRKIIVEEIEETGFHRGSNCNQDEILKTIWTKNGSRRSYIRNASSAEKCRRPLRKQRSKMYSTDPSIGNYSPLSLSGSISTERKTLRTLRCRKDKAELPIYNGDTQENCSKTSQKLNGHPTIALKTLYKCDMCSLSFKQKKLLKKHSLIHKRKLQDNKCNFCDKIFTKKSHLTRHRRMHTGEKPFKCSTCSKAFTRTSYLKFHHLKIHKNGGQFKCTTCNKEFVLSSILKNHMKTHLRAEKFKCTMCGKCFNRKKDLKVHILIHGNEKPFKCTVETCGKEFVLERDLKRHIRIHPGEKQFQCTTCGKGFLRKSNLKAHMFSHMAIKPFKCDTCGKAYTQKRSLEAHKFTHMAIKPFECDMCGKGFTEKRGLESHMKTHGKERPFKCDQCDYTSIYNKNLKSHKATKHLDTSLYSALPPLNNFKCQECGTCFETADKVKQHYNQTHFGLDFSDDCVIQII